MAVKFQPSRVGRRNPEAQLFSGSVGSFYSGGKEYYVENSFGGAGYSLRRNDNWVMADPVVYKWNRQLDGTYQIGEGELKNDVAAVRKILTDAVNTLASPDKDNAQILINNLPPAGSTQVPAGQAPVTTPSPQAPVTTPSPILQPTPEAPSSQQPSTGKPPKKKLTEQVWFYPTIAGGIVLISAVTIYAFTLKRKV